MTGKQRQYALLAVLGVVLFAAWWVVLRDDPAETATRPSNRTARRGAPATEGGTAAPVENIALDRLQTERDALQPVERNPFRFRPKPPPPPPRPVARVQPSLPVPSAPTGPPPLPPIPLKYIGYADEAGPKARFGVFSDGRGTVINAFEGDILEGRYRVLRIGTDSADLAYLDGRGRQTIRLSGQ